METRANYVWVGVVTLALLAALALFVVWLAQLGAANRKTYDIFFQQSVGGLANGSDVSFSGVPVGQVQEIDLWKADPGLVRVRIAVKPDVPILMGTTASVSSSFTGVSTINLDGAVRGAPPITCETTSCPAGAPLIPTKPGGIGEILASAPLLLERLTTLTERLSSTLSPQNQRSITGILANTERLTDGLADTTPELQRTLEQTDATLAQLQQTLSQASQTLATFDRTLNSTDRLINEEGAAISAELRRTLGSAERAATALETTANAARPGAEGFSRTTLPAADATLRDLQRTSRALRDLTDRLSTQGASSLVRGTKLPDYEPEQ
ncbi:MlaD family protein [Altericroceibacterium xinjiangense]|uniref:MlaD family protein n=1 Tax=Altericroceibacterium xinjiangense TaxID=762261 RepID=UPI000F7DD94F|nr:MlaD family protein [Altericroceibacterium xinjiangense]